MSSFRDGSMSTNPTSCQSCFPTNTAVLHRNCRSGIRGTESRLHKIDCQQEAAN